jgi:predicted RNase H-like HicB family nuclease
MTTFIAMVQADGDGEYTASFADFPECSVASPTLDDVIRRAREALLRHIDSLIDTGRPIQSPTPIDVLQRGSALLFAAIDVPDDLRIAQVDLAIPALSLARIESFADRHGMSLATLFINAVDRWAMQEAMPRVNEGGGSDGPTLFDFGNPPELRVEAAAAQFGPANGPQAMDDREELDSADKPNGITAELARLLDDSSRR